MGVVGDVSDVDFNLAYVLVSQKAAAAILAEVTGDKNPVLYSPLSPKKRRLRASCRPPWPR